MRTLTQTQKALLLLLVVFFAVGGFLLLNQPEPTIEHNTPEEPVISEPVPKATSTQSQIGTSVEGRAIESFTFGTGSTSLLFVGGVHGGYEANTVRLAEAMIDEFQKKPELVPENITIHIIPVLNPDGYARHQDQATNYTDGQKRFNANGVDLNRNFGCKWAPQSSWRGQTVSAGTAAFSEPEAQALRQYVRDTSPKAAVFWHSVANNVYASECENGILPQTLTLMNVYAEAGNYGKVEKFDAYPITGDVEGWLASIGIPAITVELETRDSIEWTRNFAGTQAVLQMYTQ
jgi:predicted deacylase